MEPLEFAFTFGRQVQVNPAMLTVTKAGVRTAAVWSFAQTRTHTWRLQPQQAAVWDSKKNKKKVCSVLVIIIIIITSSHHARWPKRCSHSRRMQKQRGQWAAVTARRFSQWRWLTAEMNEWMKWNLITTGNQLLLRSVRVRMSHQASPCCLCVIMLSFRHHKKATKQPLRMSRLYRPY